MVYYVFLIESIGFCTKKTFRISALWPKKKNFAQQPEREIV